MSNTKKKPKVDSFTKLIVFIVVLHGLTMITCSYILAWFGRDPVVDISTTLISEVVAPVTLQIVCNLISNIFEKNKLKFSTPLTQLDKEMDMMADKDVLNPKG